MTVSREAAIWAYRLILGREPESEAVIEQAIGASDVAELRRQFLNSAEFRGGFSPDEPRVGRLHDIDRIDIDLEATPEQLQAMLDRIGDAWRDFGRTDAHWSVMTDDRYRAEIIGDNIEQFYATGVVNIEIYLNFLRRSGIPIQFRRALDFGCGVGRLTLALSRFADQVTGVDISPPHLALAEARAQETGARGVEFQTISSIDDIDRFRGYDLVVSLIVLQHNPPPVMAAIYERLLATLNPGGVAIVQMPTLIRGQVFSAESYLGADQPQLEMNCLPQKAIFEIIARAQCDVLEVREDESAGFDDALSHTFLVRKR